jgi:hypothetical protein
MRWQIGAMLVMVLMNLAQGQTQPSGGSSSQVVGTQPTSQKAQTPVSPSPVPRPSPPIEVRLKDIATVHWGVEVPLVGYGLGRRVGWDGRLASSRVYCSIHR